MGNRKTRRGAMLFVLAFVAIMVIESQIKMKMADETFKVINLSLNVLYILSLILFIRSRIKADRKRRLKVREAELYADNMSLYYGAGSGSAVNRQSISDTPYSGSKGDNYQRENIPHPEVYDEDIVHEYSDEITRNRSDRSALMAQSLKKSGKAFVFKVLRTVLIIFLLYFVIYLLFYDGDSVTSGKTMSGIFMMMKNTVKSLTYSDGMRWVPILVIGVLFVLWRTHKRQDIKGDSVVYTKMIPPGRYKIYITGQYIPS